MNKVWLYTITRKLEADELEVLHESGKSFVDSWTAHDKQLTAEFEILKGRIIIVKVLESGYNASGCSIDKLTRFMKETGSRFNIDLLNRLFVAYKQADAIEVAHHSQIKELLKTGAINENTIIFNTSVSTEPELQNWEQALKNTWLKKELVK